MSQQLAACNSERYRVQLVYHALRHSEVLADVFNAENNTNFTYYQLDNMWDYFALTNEPLLLSNDRTPALAKADIAQLQPFVAGNYQSRFTSQIVRRAKLSYRTSYEMHYHSLIPTTLSISNPHRTLYQFLAYCYLEQSVLYYANKIPSTAYAIVHSLKTVVVQTHKMIVLSVYASQATKTNAVIFFDENYFWLANCGFDGSQAERIGVEVNGQSMRNGYRVLLGTEDVVFRVCGQWFLWHKLS